MTSPADHHDTIVLTHDTVALPRTQPAASWDARSPYRGPVHAGSAWSQVPPLVGAPPVLIMRNNAAVVGATLGSVSLFLALIPLIGVVAWVLAPIGLMSSVLGLVVGASRKVGRVGALWGVLTSGAALLVCLAWVALLLAL
ncbi:MAG: hypothetical protein MUF09_10395 [Candidatus Nanopelagicales bacterium]|jgi:hypothetical protein|nr:hypothetical protein [Candidatus Nanopelagicales bacterium]